MKRVILLYLLLLAGYGMPAQTPPSHRPGEILVQLEKGIRPEQFIHRSAGSQLTLKKVISAELGIYLLSFNQRYVEEAAVLSRVKQDPAIKAAQLNRAVQLRSTIPNDEFFERQWHLDLIQAPEVWNFTTGGLSARGDTIVVAVLDSAFDPAQEDLKDNIWRNHAEIPDDGIDNDNNGYIDDYLGWNVKKGNDDHFGSIDGTAHGTASAGIIGARGNNEIGVAGLNWNVKLMLLSGTQFESEIVEAYLYARAFRKRYNESGCSEGAFVVATNISLGIDEGQASDYPIWCAVYDQMGEVGILNTGSTTNKNINVDQEGDIPTNCNSEFLISVTNSNQDDEKINSGFGSRSVDLSAPGSGAFTTRPNNEYSIFPGTSAAAPQVAGAIALIYSLPADSLARLACEKPRSTALLVKDFIFKGTKPLDDLQGITVTGGRLDLLNSLDQVRQHFGGTSGELSILKLYPNPASSRLRIEFQSPDFDPYWVRVFNSLGQLVYEEEIQPQQFSSKFHDLTVSGWPRGIYAIAIQRGKQVNTTQFVKL